MSDQGPIFTLPCLSVSRSLSFRDLTDVTLACEDTQAAAAADDIMGGLFVVDAGSSSRPKAVSFNELIEFEEVNAFPAGKAFSCW